MTHHFRRRRSLVCALLASGAAGMPILAAAQSTGLLYDPQPPADSAYVRVIALGAGPVDVSVAGVKRIKGLAAGEPSEYMVLAAGKHQFELSVNGKPGRRAAVNVQSGRVLTIAFAGAEGDAPIVFEDRANTNKLKAVLAVYHLHAKSGALDLLAGDGSTRVFQNVAYGSSSALSVNPVSVDVFAAAAGDKAKLASASLAMAPGGTYSLFLVPGPKNALELHALTNRIERYTGSPKSS
ncbi:alginate O-acetyltransferase AlgF [Noviherbaspirillum galbum]|uniref:Alginate biosynthesis protein AlgF n=1 Tax=Noviherbaspirillum galbum TaxID=2709383 RepID=A0A6B3SJZ0_9BURK|nr:alginate O-acetyltransferase AlgF [Noviherbaspirillum galbum]NEX61073.1 DUF4397 domain-containing protein [Noviherbaspirillum galbum]